jgi:hypothetical protein
MFIEALVTAAESKIAGLSLRRNRANAEKSESIELIR